MFAVVSSVVFWDKQPLYATYSLEFCGFYITRHSMVEGSKKDGNMLPTLGQLNRSVEENALCSPLGFGLRVRKATWIFY